MPERETIERARADKRQGKSATTQAGEFVREEMHHIREGKHGARSTKQAIAIGLSKARRAGVDLKPPARGKTSERTRPSLCARTRRAAEAPTLGQALSSDPSGAGARREVRGIPRVAFKAGALCGTPAKRSRTLISGRKGCAHQRSSQAACCGHESGPHKRSRGPFPGRPQSGAEPRRACLVLRQSSIDGSSSDGHQE